MAGAELTGPKSLRLCRVASKYATYNLAGDDDQPLGELWSRDGDKWHARAEGEEFEIKGSGLWHRKTVARAAGSDEELAVVDKHRIETAEGAVYGWQRARRGRWTLDQNGEALVTFEKHHLSNEQRVVVEIDQRPVPMVVLMLACYLLVWEDEVVVVAPVVT